MRIVVLLVVSVLLSALFSGMEIAFVSANRLRMEMGNRRASLTQRVVSLYAHAPAHFISTLIVGNNIALVCYGIAMNEVIDPWIGAFTTVSTNRIILQTLISTAVIVLFAEFLPKAIFSTQPNYFLNLFALPVFLFHFAFYPISRGVTLLTNGLLRVFSRGGDRSSYPDRFGIQDLSSLVDQAASEQSGHEQPAEEQRVRYFQNALEFSDLRTRDCLVPRTELEMVGARATIDEVKSVFIRTGFSRLPVYDGTIDNIVGYVNSKSLFDGPRDTLHVVREILFVPETMRARDLLAQFLRTGNNLAIVVDEYGGTAGLVTLEDLVEEIFGDIDDEHDTQELVMRRLSGGEYLLSGLARVHLVNETLELSIPESDDYETVAGFILANHPSIPRAQETLVVGRFSFTVMQVVRNRIVLVSLRVDEQQED